MTGVHSDLRCPRCGATSSHMRDEGFVICSHCDALVHNGEAMAKGGADAIRRMSRAMHSPEEVDAEAQETQLAMMKADAAGDLDSWRDAFRHWLTLMPVTYPAHVPHWARDAASFARWVDESVDSATLAKTDPKVKAAQEALPKEPLRADDLLQSAQEYYECCYEVAKVSHQASLQRFPNARWLRERSVKDLAADSFRLAIRARVVMLPEGALPKIFAHVLGDRHVASGATCTTCTGPREADDGPCQWCGALRVRETDPSLMQLQGTVDSLVQRGESDQAIASGIFGFEIAPAWNGHALPHGGQVAQVVQAVAPWLSRQALIEVATNFTYMPHPAVVRYMTEAKAALASHQATGTRPPKRPVKPLRTATSFAELKTDPWVRKTIAQFEMIASNTQDRVSAAASQTLLPSMMGGAISPAQAATFLKSVLSPAELATVPALLESWHLGYPSEAAFLKAVSALVST